MNAAIIDGDSKVINALRGYAILLVIFSHIAGHIPNLVWPLKRIMLMGFYGVQLFFIASALTLMISWSKSRGSLIKKTHNFFIKRFFHIAPLYFLAIPFYWIVNNIKSEDFSWSVLLATIGFYNAWSPSLIPTIPGWTPVPGGWSIGVEFNFYLIFPALILFASTLRRAYFFFTIALLTLVIAYPIGREAYAAIEEESRANFLYYWPPNQIIIFSIGFILYYLVGRIDPASFDCSKTELGRLRPTFIFIVVFFALSFVGQHKFFDVALVIAPIHVLVSLLFAYWIYNLILNPSKFVINDAVCRLGKVSFSAYVLHFSIISLAAFLFNMAWPFSTAGLMSIAYTTLFAVFVVPVTFVASNLTFKWIEKPFIDFAKNITR